MIEIHSGRVFASMLSEKRILFLVLPPFEEASLDPKLEDLDSFLLRLEQAQVQDEIDQFGGELEGLRQKRAPLDDKISKLIIIIGQLDSLILKSLRLLFHERFIFYSLLLK